MSCQIRYPWIFMEHSKIFLWGKKLYFAYFYLNLFSFLNSSKIKVSNFMFYNFLFFSKLKEKFNFIYSVSHDSWFIISNHSTIENRAWECHRVHRVQTLHSTLLNQRTILFSLAHLICYSTLKVETNSFDIWICQTDF